MAVLILQGGEAFVSRGLFGGRVTACNISFFGMAVGCMFCTLA